jgi:hypothetical protein
MSWTSHAFFMATANFMAMASAYMPGQSSSFMAFMAFMTFMAFMAFMAFVAFAHFMAFMTFMAFMAFVAFAHFMAFMAFAVFKVFMAFVDATGTRPMGDWYTTEGGVVENQTSWL